MILAVFTQNKAPARSLVLLSRKCTFAFLRGSKLQSFQRCFLPSKHASARSPPTPCPQCPLPALEGTYLPDAQTHLYSSCSSFARPTPRQASRRSGQTKHPGLRPRRLPLAFRLPSPFYRRRWHPTNPLPCFLPCAAQSAGERVGVQTVSSPARLLRGALGLRGA